jgi:hypothetical protein
MRLSFRNTLHRRTTHPAPAHSANPRRSCHPDTASPCPEYYADRRADTSPHTVEQCRATRPSSIWLRRIATCQAPTLRWRFRGPSRGRGSAHATNAPTGKSGPVRSGAGAKRRDRVRAHRSAPGVSRETSPQGRRPYHSSIHELTRLALRCTTMQNSRPRPTPHTTP